MSDSRKNIFRNDGETSPEQSLTQALALRAYFSAQVLRVFAGTLSIALIFGVLFGVTALLRYWF